jgi:hypothetical protein
MKGFAMKTLWAMIEALTDLNSKSPGADFVQVLSVPLIQSESSNEYFSFYKNKEPIVMDGIVASEVTISFQNDTRTIKGLTLRGLREACIDKESTLQRYRELKFHSLPSAPSPNATSNYSVLVNKHQVIFGFTQNPTCLSLVSISYAQ